MDSISSGQAQRQGPDCVLRGIVLKDEVCYYYAVERFEISCKLLAELSR